MELPVVVPMVLVRGGLETLRVITVAANESYVIAEVMLPIPACKTIRRYLPHQVADWRPLTRAEYDALDRAYGGEGGRK